MDVLNAIGDIFYGGIQPNIPGNGGPDCVAFLSKGQLLFETLLDTALMVCARKDLHPTRQSGQRGERPAIQESAPRCSIGHLRYRDRVQGLLATAAQPGLVPNLICIA